MSVIQASFWGLAGLAFLAACYGAKRYRSPLNPLTIFIVTQIGMLTILSGVVAVNAMPNYNRPDIVKTVYISLVYLGATTLPYFFRGSILSRLFGKVMRFVRLDSESVALHFSFVKFTLLLVGAAVSFAVLAIVGGGGWGWLTNSRAAYLGYRSGAGPFFALTQWLLTFAMIYCVWTTKPRALKLILILFLFCIAMSFLGSKNNILTLLVIGITYYNFYVKRLSFLVLMSFVPLFLLAVLGLLIRDGAYSSLMQAGLYFRDYFDTTVQFLSRFNEFGFRYGQGWLSSFWAYVPRCLFPDKPYEYGIVLIHQVLFPGAAALGYTPGVLPWSLAYLDFGVAGVFLYGLFGGIWQRMAFEYFLGHKQQLIAFMLAMQFSIWPIWTFAPLMFILVLSIFQSIYLRTVWRNNAVRTT